MTHDLDVATAVKPEIAHIRAFASRHGLECTGDFASDDEVTIERAGFHGTSLAEVYPPTEILEPEDLNESLARIVQTPCWLTELAISTIEEEGGNVGTDLAQHLAEACRGAVYDPQADAILWPRGVRAVTCRRPRAHPDGGLGMGPCASAVWRPEREGVPRRHPGDVPEALPSRFGTSRPLRGRLGSADDAPFLEAWAAAMDEGAGGLILESQGPCFGGSVDYPLPERPRAVGEINLYFDARMLVSNPRWRDSVVSLFEEVARRLGAFYGRGYVRRNMWVHGRAVASDGTSEILPSGFQGWTWIGIPSGAPTWLTWFGRPYMDLVARAVSTQESRRFPEGVSLRLDREPKDRDQLRGAFPPLPPDLLSSVEKQPPPRDPKVTPAEVIPPLS